ncbi:MAG: ABC transporter substrate-binding protein [Dehalococcoidia bacterium]
MEDNRYWTSARSSVSRRRFLGGSMAVGAGLAGAALIGCGSSGGGETPAAGGTGGGAATGGSAAPSGPTIASITGANWKNRDDKLVPKYGGTLNWSPGSPTLANLDPLTSTSAMVHQVSMPVYGTLMHIGRDPKDRNSPWEYFPELATKWEVTDPLKMVFTLREGVKFHNVAPVNGRPFTSEDVKFALNRAATDKGSLFKGAFAAIKSIDTPDAKTVVINMKQYSPLMMPQLGGHFGWITPKELIDDSLIRSKSIGTGPFMFQKWEKDSVVNYKKNPDFYVKGAPFVDELNWFIIGNEDTRTAAFQSGQTQIYDVPDNAIKDVKGNKDYTVEDYLRTATACGAALSRTRRQGGRHQRQPAVLHLVPAVVPGLHAVHRSDAVDEQDRQRQAGRQGPGDHAQGPGRADLRRSLLRPGRPGCARVVPAGLPQRRSEERLRSEGQGSRRRHRQGDGDHRRQGAAGRDQGVHR